MFGKMAVIYGAEHLFEVAARWKIQVNENVKGWAFNAAFPELNHNSASGYEVPAEITKNTMVVMLRSETLHPAFFCGIASPAGYSKRQALNTR
jgi:glucose-6-phosphate isomerase